jgi:hypothetical protein
MSFITLRDFAVAGSLVAGLTLACTEPAAAQQKPPIFSPDLSVG